MKENLPGQSVHLVSLGQRMKFVCGVTHLGGVLSDISSVGGNVVAGATPADSTENVRHLE